MKINDIFFSIQGEGLLAGVPSAFIRTTGCNLRCVWCDSFETSWNPVGKEFTLEQIVNRVSDYPTKHVVITGGEPLLAGGIEQLTGLLCKAGYHITLETAATIWKNVYCDLASLSPKLATSTPWNSATLHWAQKHENLRLNTPVILNFMSSFDYQLKFVVDQMDDLIEINAMLDTLPGYDPGRVLLMPQGVDRDELASRARWIVDICKQRGFRYCPRLHIELFGHRPGT